MKTRILLTLALIGLPAQILSAAPQYTVTEIPGAPGGDFRPQRINNRGEVVGALDFDEGPFDNKQHAAFYRDGVTIDVHLQVSPGTNTGSSDFEDLNDRGQAILYTGEGRYFIYHNGALKPLPRLQEPYYFEPVALNKFGWISGTIYVVPPNEALRAVLYKHGTFRGLGEPGVRSEAGEINDRGQILGRHGDDGVIFFRNRIEVLEGISFPMRLNNRGDVLAFDNRTVYGASLVRFNNGEVVEVPFRPGGINDRRQVVGSKVVFDHDLNSRGMLHVEGVTYDLNDLVPPRTAKVIYAYDINNRGQIVGWGRSARTLTWSGLLLTPVKREATFEN